MSGIYRLHVNQYTHILDNNSCEVFTLVGPISFTLQEHHHVLYEEPKRCVVIPPNHYVTVSNPVKHDGSWETFNPAVNAPSPFVVISGNPPAPQVPKGARYEMGKQELRFAQSPFFLFPGESVSDVMPQQLVPADTALVIEVLEPFTTTVNGTKIQRNVLERFLVTGPLLYQPQLGTAHVDTIKCINVNKSQALHLRAKSSFVDHEGVAHTEGKQWTEKVTGKYFVHPCVEVVRVLEGYVLDDVTALKITALEAFEDTVMKKKRKVGEQWLLLKQDIEDVYVPGHRENVKVETLVQLGPWQYCVVCNPYRNGKVHPGEKVIRKGPCSFFLYPEELLTHNGICSAYILSNQEALLVKARETFTDETSTHREIGSQWLIRGPCCYFPPLNVIVKERRSVVALNQNEGVYVRNIKTGVISSKYGVPFMLNEEEELWEKPLTPLVRRLLEAPRLSLRASDAPELFRDTEDCEKQDSIVEMFPLFTQAENEFMEDVKVQTKDFSRFAVVRARAEQNTLIRLYDQSKGTTRVVAGPAVVMLEPHEEFTSVVLSGGTPKQRGQIHCLSLYLGPDYMSDSIEIETVDHARLTLRLAYNWEFDAEDPHLSQIAFTISDFIGEACKALASRIRSRIASETFDTFHKESSNLVKQAIFSAGADSSTEVLENGGVLYFKSNGLRITNVDVQSVMPVDPRTSEALVKSVQLAVEIITKSQENYATNSAMLLEQEAKGALELQTIKDKCSCEEIWKGLLEVRAKNNEIEKKGYSVAQALAESKAQLMEAETDLELTPVRIAAHKVGVEAELDILQKRMEADLSHRKQMNDLEVDKVQRLADIEAAKYENIMEVLGKETVVALARAGPELQAKLLGALGLQGFLVTDGTNPINLMNTAQQLTAAKQ